MLNNLSNELTQAHSSGKALLKELKAILKQRADAESEYARALERVAQRLFKLANSGGGGSDENQQKQWPQTARVYMALRSAVLTQAEQGQQLANSLRTDLSTYIQNTKKAHAERLKAVLSKCNVFDSEFQTTLKRFEDARGRYARKREAPEEQDLRTATDLYNQQVDQYEVTARAVAAEGEAFEQERSEVFVDALTKYLVYQIGYLKSVEYDFCQTAKKLEEYQHAKAQLAAQQVEARTSPLQSSPNSKQLQQQTLQKMDFELLKSSAGLDDNVEYNNKADSATEQRSNVQSTLTETDQSDKQINKKQGVFYQKELMSAYEKLKNYLNFTNQLNFKSKKPKAIKHYFTKLLDSSNAPFNKQEIEEQLAVNYADFNSCLNKLAEGVPLTAQASNKHHSSAQGGANFARYEDLLRIAELYFYPESLPQDKSALALFTQAQDIERRIQVLCDCRRIFVRGAQEDLFKQRIIARLSIVALWVPLFRKACNLHFNTVSQFDQLLTTLMDINITLDELVKGAYMQLKDGGFEKEFCQEVALRYLEEEQGIKDKAVLRERIQREWERRPNRKIFDPIESKVHQLFDTTREY